MDLEKARLMRLQHQRAKFHGDHDQSTHNPHGGGGGSKDDELTSVREAKSPPFVQDVMTRFPSGEKLKGYLETLPTEKLEKARELLKKHEVRTAGARYVDKYIEDVLSARRKS